MSLAVVRPGSWTVVSLLLLTAGVANAIAAAPSADPAGRRAGTTAAVERERAQFEAVVARVARLAESGQWKEPGWKDEALAEGLSGLIDRLKKATGRDDLALPVELADVRPPDEQPMRQDVLPGTLLVGRDHSAGRATRAVILADGNVRIAFASECVIIARGAVEVSHGNGNVILAGHYIHVSHDGNPMPGGRRRGAAAGSILVSGGYVDVSHATATVVCAPAGVDIGFAHGVTFVNTPSLGVAHQDGCREVQADDLPLTPPEKPNALAGRLTVTQVVHNDNVARRCAVVRVGGGEVPVRPGAEVRDGNGHPVPGLEGWKLTFVYEDFALFSRDGVDAGFLLKPAR
jgi:hypothetical protein